MISTRLFTLFALAASYPLSQAVDLNNAQILDVWNPPVLYPHQSTQWYTGEVHHVKWDTSNPPDEITNPVGTLYLVSNGIIDLDNPLASDFSLWDGQVTITVPSVSSGVYQLDLMGDSGNDSEYFNIN